MEDLHCKIYVSTDLNSLDLSKIISSSLNGELKEKSVILESLKLEVLENESVNPEISDDSKNTYLNYPIIVEIEPKEKINQDFYIYEVKNILNAFINFGYKAVAACKFEDQL